MKYRIIKVISVDHQLNTQTDLYETIESIRFHILRKGKIFGFWHHFSEWADLKTLEQAKSYLECRHIEDYGYDEPISIEYDHSVTDDPKKQLKYIN